MDTLQILDNFEMPADATKKAGSRKSRYLSAEQFSVIKSLKVGQATVIPFLKDTDAQYQKACTAHRIALEFGRNRTDLPDYILGVLPDRKAEDGTVIEGGIAIKKVKEYPAKTAEPVKAEAKAEPAEA